MEFGIFCKKSRQNERRSALCSLDVNKVSHNFFNKTKIGIFGEKSCQNERSSALCSLDVNKVSRIFPWFFLVSKNSAKRHLVYKTVMKLIKIEHYLLGKAMILQPLLERHHGNKTWALEPSIWPFVQCIPRNVLSILERSKPTFDRPWPYLPIQQFWYRNSVVHLEKRKKISLGLFAL